MQIVPAVSPDERQTYEEEAVLPNNGHIREATSEHDFRFDVLGTPNSPWNKSAVRIFADFTIHQLCLPNTIEMFNGIRGAFTAHLETIIRRYKHAQLPQAEQACIESEQRRHSRKYQLFHQRRYLAYTFGPLQRHIAMLEHLGVDGMSSDESQTEVFGEQPQYFILSPLWRSQDIAGWFRMFDSLHNILRRSGEVYSAAGSFPRRRKVTQKKSKSIKFVPGLPENVYDTRWIESDLLRKYDLRPSLQHYDFSHHPRIIEFVNSILAPYPF
ncbi:hypothetical protein B0H17DRAFT_963108 [Mycena rosella]|uniref:Uncharacterized protein n=1 Tax=Mycena rosella TaxID=1033263 RepID=A0AAD7BQK5_MYCRO|nr:hypothetical protein B0H17DRAFT_963108 [Mycena rosella]